MRRRHMRLNSSRAKSLRKHRHAAIGLAVDQQYLARPAGARDPREKIALSRVRGETIDRVDPCAHANFLVEQTHAAGTVDDRECR